MFMAFSCSVKEELVVLDPALCTAPVVNSYNLTDDGIEVQFTAGALNVKAPVYHALVLTSYNGKAYDYPLNSIEKDGVLSITNQALSSALIGFGAADGDVVDLEMVVRVSPQQKQTGNHNGYVDSATKIPVSGFTVVVPAGNPWGDYTAASPWGLIGAIASTGNSWNADEPMFMNSTGTKHVARNVKLSTNDQFKVRKDADWGVNFGAPGDTEPYVMTVGTPVEATSGGKNLAVPADGNYDLLLDEEAGTLILSEAFQTYPGYDEISNWSVIGAIASFEMSWDKDIQMITNGEWHVAEGVSLTANDQFKFRMDQDWGTNIGAQGDTEPFVVTLGEEYVGSNGGKNLAVPADGVYDLLCNPATNAFKVVETMGGKSPLIGGGDEPTPGPAVTGWNIIGLNGDWENDVVAVEDGNVWTAYITANEDTAFKWRKDGGWDENYGGTLEAFGEPFAAEAGGGDIAIPAGFYKVVLDLDALTITVYEGNVFSLIGQINGDSWSQDVEMAEENGVWTSPVVYIDGGFKIRHNFSWADENTYGAEADFTPAPGVPFTAVQPGSDIKLEGGNYSVRFNPETLEILILSVDYELPEIDLNAYEYLPVMEGAETWGIIGPAVLDWSTDVDLQKISDDPEIWAAMNVPFKSDNFKFRGNDTWDVYDLGGGTFALNEPIVMTQGGRDIAATRGVYTVYLYPTYGVAYLTEGSGDVPLPDPDPTQVSIIGTVNGDAWSVDIDMTNTSGTTWVAKNIHLTASDEFKFREDHSWDARNWGGPMANSSSTIDPDNVYDVFQPVVGEPFETGGYNIQVGIEGDYDITFNYGTTCTVLIEEHPEGDVWSLIGVNGDWGTDIDMTELMPGVWVSPKLTIESAGWKVRCNHDWADNRGGALEGEGIFAEAVPDGGDIALTGTFQVVYNANNETIGTLVWGVVGSVASIDGFSWNKDIPMNLASDGKWYSLPVTLAEGDEIKIRKYADWAENFGGTFSEADAPFDAVAGGDNIKAAGTYMVVYDPEAGTLTLSKQFWGLIGDFNGWGGDKFMLYDGAAWVAYNQTLEGGWKIRQGADWAVNRGGIFEAIAAPFVAVPNGDNIVVDGFAHYKVMYEPAHESICVM